jgi:hypothetical protein
MHANRLASVKQRGPAPASPERTWSGLGATGKKTTCVCGPSCLFSQQAETSDSLGHVRGCCSLRKDRHAEEQRDCCTSHSSCLASAISAGEPLLLGSGQLGPELRWWMSLAWRRSCVGHQSSATHACLNRIQPCCLTAGLQSCCMVATRRRMVCAWLAHSLHGPTPDDFHFPGFKAMLPAYKGSLRAREIPRHSRRANADAAVVLLSSLNRTCIGRVISRCTLQGRC